MAGLCPQPTLIVMHLQWTCLWFITAGACDIFCELMFYFSPSSCHVPNTFIYNRWSACMWHGGNWENGSLGGLFDWTPQSANEDNLMNVISAVRWVVLRFPVGKMIPEVSIVQSEDFVNLSPRMEYVCFEYLTELSNQSQLRSHTFSLENQPETWVILVQEQRSSIDWLCLNCISRLKKLA